MHSSLKWQGCLQLANGNDGNRQWNWGLYFVALEKVARCREWSSVETRASEMSCDVGMMLYNYFSTSAVKLWLKVFYKIATTY